MHLNMEKHKNNLLVEFKGELDHHIAEIVRQKIDQQYLDKSLKNIILDLRGLSFMDSSGIGLVMGRYKNCKDKNGNLLIVSDNSNVNKMIKMSGLSKIINIYSSIELAMESL